MNITDGLWYIKTKYPPYYDVVSIITCAIGPDVGKKWVFLIDKEGNLYPEDLGEDIFISPVPSPFGDKIDE